MSKFGGNIPIEYFMLEIDSEGPPIGYLGGQPIPGTVVDIDGQRYSYAGLAPRGRDGKIDLAALRPQEWIVRPGLIYFQDG
jgi:hypothetical protein